MLNLNYGDIVRISKRGRHCMESFVLAGKAKTVFQLIDLMAKGEKAEKVQKIKEKKNKK